MRFYEMLYSNVGHELKKKSTHLLQISINESLISNETCLVDIDGFNIPNLLSGVIVLVAAERNMTVVMGSGWMNPYQKRYAHVYTVSSFNKLHKNKRPSNILITEGVDIDKLKLGNRDKIISGFVDYEKYQRRELRKLKLREEVK
ncbi:hypothetical protein [Paenibacillus sp. LK1]|uniref:hypothetical protein n=1 Tax=Paenibacillus sp. LK1 TaxID=2053014 RepID=UPI000C1A74C6|nr:hypothetical protein [Paenibacillus sp. LK1]PIH61524.1 hypothetical protein CS562_03710 [Paenibacillus sp. LK1]